MVGVETVTEKGSGSESVLVRHYRKGISNTLSVVSQNFSPLRVSSSPFTYAGATVVSRLTRGSISFSINRRANHWSRAEHPPVPSYVRALGGAQGPETGRR